MGEFILFVCVILFAMFSMALLFTIADKKVDKLSNELERKPIEYHENDIICMNSGLFEGFVNEDIISIRLNGNSQQYKVQNGTVLSIRYRKFIVNTVNYEKNSIILTLESKV